MKVVCIGGGPAGLYFAILLKEARPDCSVVVYERNRPEDTFGFGVVFSDETMNHVAESDPDTFAAIREEFAHWKDIEIHIGDQIIRSTGHGFSGLSRHRLLHILRERCAEVGVTIHFEAPIHDLSLLKGADLIVAADGINSGVRQQFAEFFRPHIDLRPNRFLWLGTTFPFEAFTFLFRKNEHGLFRVHAYRYAPDKSTFIVETTDETWRRAGLDTADEHTSRRYCEDLFHDVLKGHGLLTNQSVWRQFQTITNEHWFHKNIVLLGDAAHTAHFSVGSGTKLAMEDAIVLVEAIQSTQPLANALQKYEDSRKVDVERIQRAAQSSLEWFEHTERYVDTLSPLRFSMSLLMRSLRVTHSNLKVRDPALIELVDNDFAQEAFGKADQPMPNHPVPPMFTPLKLRDLVIPNRVVVSPMCQYSATDGVPNDWHLVHLGSRATGGAGLVIAEATAVTPEGRISPGCTGLYNDAHTQAWRHITEYVHKWSTAKIGIQLAHSGRKGSTNILWEGMDKPLESDNWPLVAPSPLPYLPGSQVPKEMTESDFEVILNAFEQATLRAVDAGFDLVELHCAHGYLLSSFLSPLTNHRTDQYGLDLDGRMRFPLEVFHRVRSRWPQHLPVSVRVSATDWVDGGFTPDDAVIFARKLKEAGCDLVDVSAGGNSPDQRPRYGRLFQTPFADQIRQETHIATMAVGNITSFEDINSILVTQRADLCALARGHLYDPYWTRHAAAAQNFSLRWPNQYISVTRFQPR